MNHRHRVRLILHGAVVLLIGLLCGLPTVSESLGGETTRVWHTAHEALIMMGIWMLAMSSVIGVLVLPRREATALFWSLVGMGYSFVVALLIGGIIGETPFSPGGTRAAFTAFAAAALGILCAILSAALTVMGARGALKHQAAREPAHAKIEV